MQAIVFSGLQGCGKTTFYRDRLVATHVRLSLDLLKTRNRQDVLLHACLAAQQPFVVDNTNPRADQRRRYAAIAKACGFRAELYYFECTVAEALRRNATRTGAARVPDVAIFGTHAKFEPPTAAEGFDSIYVVRTAAGDGTFSVEEWQPG